MKRTKQHFKEAKVAHDLYWDSYLKGDIDRLVSLLDEQYTQIGSVEDEVFLNKKDAAQFIRDTIDQIVGNLEMRNRNTHEELVGDYILFQEHCDLFVKTEDGWVFYSRFRASTLMQLKEGNWKIIHQHSSLPDSKAQEGENIALEKISAENLELREAVKRRTVELEIKNRDLAVEAALERVRAKTMAMHTTSELQQVIHAVHQELIKLEISILGGSFIVINSEIDDEIRCWGSGGTADTSDEVHIPFYNNPFYTDIIKGIKAGPGFFTEEFTQQEKQEFFTFLFQNEPWSNIDAKEKQAVISSPGGYTRSCAVFENTSIFIINQSGRPFSSDENDILKRFGKVFEQTYTRFLDLQKAEAQAREAQIEAALERVRASAMAMHKSEELAEVATLLYNELIKLEVSEFSAASIVIFDEINNQQIVWGGQTESEFLEKSIMPLLGDQILQELYDNWSSGEAFFTVKVGGLRLKNHNDFVFPPANRTELEDRVLKQMPDPTFFHCAVFSMGYIELVADRELRDESASLLNRFAKVFEQTYTRFLDLQKAEAQAREAQIEAALERVRAAGMAMHQSEDLAEASTVLFEQLVELGVEIRRVGFALPDDEKQEFTIWSTVRDDQGKARLLSVFLHYDQHPIYPLMIEYWHAGKKIFGFDLHGPDLQEYYKAWNKTFKTPDSLLKTIKENESEYYQFASFEQGLIYAFTGAALSKEEHLLLGRFAKAFEMTYTRFLDLQKAEAQAREAKIEAALERVRSRTMGMQHSSELTSAATLLFQQIQSLGVPPWSCGFNIWEQGDSVFTTYMGGGSENFLLEGFKIPLNEEAAFIHFQESRDRGDKLFVDVLEGEALEAHYRYFFTLPGIKEVFEKGAQEGRPRPTFQINHLANFKHGNLMFITYEPCPEAHDIFIRFAKVFEQTYTRFLDLQKAEAQAREAKIEAALERVRSRSLAMHKTDELQEVVRVVAEELKNTGVILDTWGAVICTYFQDSKDVLHWTASEDPANPSVAFLLPYFEDELFDEAWESKVRGDSYFAKVFSFEVKNAFFNHAFEHSDYRQLPDDYKKQILESETHGIAWAWAKNSAIMIPSIQGELPSKEEKEILIRFAKVFEQSFIRFLDLQKAEEQAREAQIEAALERVRSRTMAMQNSSELAETSIEMFKQMQALGMRPWACGFNIFEKDEKAITQWMAAADGGLLTPFTTPLTEDPFFIRISEARKRGEELFVMESGGQELEETYKYMFSLPGSQKALAGIMAAGFEMPKFQISHCAFFSQGYLLFITYEPYPEAYDVFKRFAKVFEQTYTRFLDLQNAEAQSREAEIQLALERVRARTMAMHKSEELSEVVALVYEQIQNLGFSDWGCSIIICDEKERVMRYWYAEINLPHLPEYSNVPLNHKIVKKAWKLWKSGVPQFDINLLGKEKESFTSFMLTDTDYHHILPEDVKKEWRNPKDIFLSYFTFKYGMLEFVDIKPLNSENYPVYERFGKVFEQTYTRFLDLQKAEARARESQIETALERVRSRTMGMQQSEELGDVATVMFNEMNGLVDDLWTCGFVLCEENRREDEWWLSMEDGFTRGFFLPNVGDFAHETLYEGWEKGESFRSVQLEGKELNDHYEWLMKIPVAEQIFVEMEASGIPRPKWQKLHAAYFKTGYLVIITEVPCAEEEIFKRFAQVFDLTYTRFLDLKQKEEQGKKLIEEKIRLERTLKDLQATQAQLIQAEKMASLGELTAGIAHEIQNPLNFVNNFSEVSGELVDEMNEEIEKGDLEEVKFIAADLKENLSKINLHGKRADAIVKGMLEHSKKGSGQKEVTDLNALADEFLRLSYQSFLAKVPDFQGVPIAIGIKTDFDPDLPKVSVIPQDIGKVLLNLINNAFYAVNEKAKSGNLNPDYEPIVTVSSKRTENGIELSVKDNGPGMPNSVKEKIFQPFFTTKPTGSGTGLGLSLSYDIMKAHGGEIKVESKEDEGTELSIILPIEAE